MSGIFFMIWVTIALTQIFVFSIYISKVLSKNRDTETVDTFPICVYNGMAYWYEKGDLYRTRYSARGMRFDNREKVNQLMSEDLSPSDIIHIIEELEEVER